MSLYILLHISVSIRETILESATFFSTDRGKKNRFLYASALLSLSHFDKFFYSFNSLAIFEAMFLKAMDVPDIRLKRTPLRERRGNLHTSISH